MLAFADTWKEVAACMHRGDSHPRLSMGPPGVKPELATLLENRSDVLRRFAEDNSVWDVEYT